MMVVVGAVSVALMIALFFFLFSRRSRPETIMEPVLTQRPQPSTYHIYSIDEIEIYENSQGAEIRTRDGISVSLSAEAAKQVHYYSAPTRGCSCTCKGNPAIEEKEGYVIGATRPEISPDSLVIGHNGSSIIVNRQTAFHVHALLRPTNCLCECPTHGMVAVPVVVR